MKKILCFAFISVLLCFFSAQSSAQTTDTKNTDKTQPANSEKHTGKNKYTVIKITQEEFKKEVFDYTDTTATFKGKKPAIVDFYADWCGPCRRLAPIMEELAGEYGKEIVIYKINTDENNDLARTFEIKSILTIYFFPVKGQARKALGLLSKEQLVEIIETILLPKK